MNAPPSDAGTSFNPYEKRRNGAADWKIPIKASFPHVVGFLTTVTRRFLYESLNVAQPKMVSKKRTRVAGERRMTTNAGSISLPAS